MLLPWNTLASTFLLRIASHSERPRFDLSLSPNDTASSHLYSTRLPSTRSLQPPQFDHAQLEERSTQRHSSQQHDKASFTSKRLARIERSAIVARSSTFPLPSKRLRWTCACIIGKHGPDARL
ncbi:hypothetical protein PGTUg99_026798 [Puccinia graminis f. sp. tritici]|uniref:Uncharacterized protein n=1 Tax=Puccinia graminis f. sp. tritici TaxID=56615 RepID=A0A5B0S6K6_PUCGR|nr:hypothetical protein PGTUg99_026798 [Puccinia graminis f. sp. tritici]